MTFIPKPQSRESILIFGDGDEAVFGYIGPSKEEGYYLIHSRPTQKMRWSKQIQDSDYDKYDGWIKNIYKKDMCIQLSYDPDFPMWLILCDYNGGEDTPLMERFSRMRQLIERNRDLEKESMNLRILLSRKRAQERKRAMHPDEHLLEIKQLGKDMKQIFGQTQVIEVPTEQPIPGEE